MEGEIEERVRGKRGCGRRDRREGEREERVVEGDCKKRGVSEHPRGAIFYCFHGITVSVVTVWVTMEQ